MKILCLSDLHICGSIDLKYKYHWIEKLLDDSIDIIVISGDIFEFHYQYMINPYQKLSKITDKPIICVLGNHEFVDNTIQDTLKYYQDLYEPNKYNVHYLDVCGHYDINNFRFVGNVLWYDAEMRQYDDQSVYDWGGNKGTGNGYWLDRCIIDFDYKKENKSCVKQIKKNISSEKENILVTHCVPIEKMNGHILNKLNIFSGMKDLLKDINVQYSISGHTHKRIIGLQVYNTFCINIGNDYYPPYLHYVLEV